MFLFHARGLRSLILI